MQKEEKKLNYWQKIKLFFKIYKILPFLDKYNPYKKIQVDEETGRTVESKNEILYREWVVWLINIHANGLFLNYITSTFRYQPFHYTVVLADGLLLWMFYKIAGDIKNAVKEIKG